MIVKRERTLTVNLGNYESYKFGASVEMSHHDMGKTDDEVRALSDDEFSTLESELSAAVTASLNNLIAEDIADARNLTTDKKSIVMAFASAITSK
jgi:hypothetical protein